MEQEQINIITIILAVIGTLTGTSALLLDFYKFLSSNYKLKISFKPNMCIANAVHPYDEKKEYIVITVTNVGKRKVKICNVALRMLHKKQKKFHYLLTDSFRQDIKRVLNEGNPSTDYLLERKGVNVENVYYVSVYDGFGKEHRKYLHRFPTFWYVSRRLFKGYK
jgi:hypothetical protein